jgi:hypothetical protein
MSKCYINPGDIVIAKHDSQIVPVDSGPIWIVQQQTHFLLIALNCDTIVKQHDFTTPTYPAARDLADPCVVLYEGRLCIMSRNNLCRVDFSSRKRFERTRRR